MTTIETEQLSPISGAPISDKVKQDRELLRQAQADGKLLRAYVRLSGPGWLQSAITLGGGSLAGALFLGVLGGTSMLWLQLVAIFFGVIMLSAISYVTLSTGRRPFEAINTEINPALGWGWLIATMLANIIWCMPQFGLCYESLDQNLIPLVSGNRLGDSNATKAMVSMILLFAAGFVVLLNTRAGLGAKIFDIVLKGLVGMIVICFFGVVILLAVNGNLDFSQIAAGLIPQLSQATQPSGELGGLVAALPQANQDFWITEIVSNQRRVMIAAAATAVGINMTFLLPYSMLTRGWDKPFRGLARFDLSTGMAIPYIIVTSCVVIAASFTFHAKLDDKLKSSDLAVMKTSKSFEGVKPILIARINHELGDTFSKPTNDEESLALETKKLELASQLSEAEKTLAMSLVKRNAFQLSETLNPLLGESNSKLVFGLGVFGMGFSTIIILMLINGYAVRELVGSPNGNVPFVTGCLVAGIAGSMWFYLYAGDAKFWLAIFASTFGSMLLPIAYITFFLMMNSKRILGVEKPTGARMVVWNVLMAAATLGALAAATMAIYETATDKKNPVAFYVVIGILGVYFVAVIIGFFYRKTPKPELNSSV